MRPFRRFTFAALGGLLLLATPVLAQPGRGMGMRGGMGGGMGLAGVGRCGAVLLHAPSDVLKARLGLSDAQVARLQPIRTNFASKRINLQAQAQQAALQLRSYLDTADLPDQKKVLDLSRKVHNLHWQMHEERVKAQIQIMQALSKDQRGKLRAECATMGPGKGMGGPGWGGGGRRWGGRSGGPGGTAWGPR